MYDDFIRELPVEEICLSLDDVLRDTSLEDDLEDLLGDFDILL